ncbi:hypothetical protein BKA93DRAFT_532607 [Sparassis latifolia]
MTTPEPDKMQAVKLDDGPNKPADQSGQGPKDDGLSSPKPQLLEVSPAPSPKPSPRCAVHTAYAYVYLRSCLMTNLQREDRPTAQVGLYPTHRECTLHSALVMMQMSRPRSASGLVGRSPTEQLGNLLRNDLVDVDQWMAGILYVQYLPTLRNTRGLLTYLYVACPCSLTFLPGIDDSEDGEQTCTTTETYRCDTDQTSKTCESLSNAQTTIPIGPGKQ